MSEWPKTDYARLFYSMPIPRFIVRPGDEGYIVTDANDLTLTYFDKDREQIVGHVFQDFIDKENANHFGQSFEVCADKKKPVSIQALPGMPAKIKVHAFLVNPVLDEDGGVLALDVIGQPDIADQSILQRERDDAISMLTSIFDVSEVGIVVSDEKGNMVRVNESFVRTFGWSKDDLINDHITSIITPDERARAIKNNEEFLAGNIRGSGEVRIICKDGHIANVLFTSAPLELSQKRKFLVTTVMDITLRKQMEHSLIEAKDQADTANRAKSSFLANMSHELRTPLNAIIGFSDMMISETFGPVNNSKYEEYLQDMNASANHLLDIINEVLDMSKIEAGRLELDESYVDVGQIIKNAMRMMASRAFGSGILMETNVHGELPHLYADERLLRQILINLITNAVKFSASGARVLVSAALEPDRSMRVSIQDEGSGIPEDRIQQALEPFGQVSEGPDQSQKQGTGLGLPLAKAMVELHGGRLDLTSELGRGTTVDIIFPSIRIKDD